MVEVLLIALVDDHKLFRERLCSFIKKQIGHNVIIASENGYQFILDLNKSKILPQIVIVDIRMTVMDGIAITHYLCTHYPTISVIGMSAIDDVMLVLDMLDAGARAFINKDTLHEYMNNAIEAVINGQIYIDPSFSVNLLQRQEYKCNTIVDPIVDMLSKREITFLQLCATDLSYELIAKVMHVSYKTVYNYHDSIKEKTGISSRINQTLFAIRNGIAKTMRRTRYLPMNK